MGLCLECLEYVEYMEYMDIWNIIVPDLDALCTAHAPRHLTHSPMGQPKGRRSVFGAWIRACMPKSGALLKRGPSIYDVMSGTLQVATHDYLKTFRNARWHHNEDTLKRIVYKQRVMHHHHTIGEHRDDTGLSASRILHACAPLKQHTVSSDQYRFRYLSGHCRFLKVTMSPYRTIGSWSEFCDSMLHHWVMFALEKSSPNQIPPNSAAYIKC